jgi:hypothetical protein
MMNYEWKQQIDRIGQCGRTITQRWRQAAVLMALSILFTSAAFGQLTTADIVGTVTDATGAVVPNANVVLSNLGTNEKRTTHTSGSGDFAFTLLLPGHYSVSVQSPGFKVSTTQDLAVEAGDRARADAHMQLGAESTTIEVEAQTPLLQADNATVSSTVTEKAVQDLPLNGRNFVQLVQLVPGANEGPGNGLTSGGRPDDRRQTAGFSVNGQDDTLNNYVIDGIDNNERIIGTIGVRPNVEGIQEISVQTNSYAPEAGRTAGGVVNIVTKSGTNNFHGSVYEYFRNDIFDARNFFARVGQSAKPELRQNQYGGSIGGPIFKDKTFFFGDYEGLRRVAGTTYSSTVPTLAQYDDIHTLNGGSPEALVAEGNGTQGYAIDPVALNYLMLFPAPNVAGATGGGNYSINPNTTQNSNVFDVRVDHSFNSNNLFFIRYTYNKVNTVTPAQLPASLTTGPLAGIIAGGGRYNFAGPATDAAQQYALNYTHIFNSNLLIDLKAAYTRINNESLPLNYGTNADTAVGFGPNMNFNATSSFLTPVGINGFNDLGDGAYVPLQDIDNTFQYLGTVSYNLGNHDLKFGAGLIRRQARNLQSAFAGGQYSFGLSTDTSTADYLASTLVGAYVVQNPMRSYDLTPPDYRSWEPSGFAQDNWKVTPNLTLVYGVRYDVFTPFTEAHNRISNFDYLQALGSNPSTIGSALKIAGVNGVSATAGIKTIYSDVAPRVGFSATVHPGTVVRGGYGLSYFPGNYTSNADLKNAPFTSVYAPGCQSTIAYNIEIAEGANPLTASPDCGTVNGSQAYATFDAGLPLPAPQNINSPSLSFTAEDPKLKPALIQQFNLQVQQEFGANVLTIGYVGNIGQHLPETINDINVPTPNAIGLSRPLNALLPNLGGVGYLASGGVSNYNSLQTSFQRRFSKGLAFDANYTWAHALSDISGFSEEGQQGWSNADPTRIRQIEYGNAENDIRNRFALSLNYELPFGKGFTGMKKLALGGWETNAIAVWQSGKPFTIVNNGSDGGFGNRASPLYNGGVDRPDQVHSASLSHKTLTEFFDTTAFQPQMLGTVGSEARNALYGPHFRHLDLSIFKDFHVTERFMVQFRAESFNLSNTPSFYIDNNVNSGPSTLLGNSQFGQITATDPNYNPRQFQFALRGQF